MEKGYCVYKITNKLNGKMYIGQTKNVKTRWRSNGIHYAGSPHIYNAILKYGWDNFIKEVMYDNLTSEEADIIEIDCIKYYNTRDRNIGYNIASGGNSGQWYLEHPRGMLGKPQTDHQKLSHSLWASDNKNNCMTNGQVIWGKTHKHPQGFKNKKHKETSKNKTSKTMKEKGVNKKEIEATFPNNSTIIFNSLDECAKYFNISPTSSVIRKLIKTGKPYKIHPSVNDKEKLKLIEGVSLKYIQKDNSEV